MPPSPLSTPVFDASAGAVPSVGGPAATAPPSDREAPGTWSGLNASVTVPLPLSQAAIVTPGGAWNCRTGRFFSAPVMKSCQIGPATCAPVWLSPRLAGLSNPTQTVVTRSGVNPENQAS